MASRYAGKYRRSPHPQATRIKTFNFLSLGGTFWHPPRTKFLPLLWGRLFLFLLEETCPPHPPLLRTLAAATRYKAYTNKLALFDSCSSLMSRLLLTACSQ